MPSRHEFPPAIAFEQDFEHRGGVERVRQTYRALVDDKRPFGMVGNEAVVLEPISVRLSSAQQFPWIIRTLPARGFFRNTFDIFQKISNTGAVLAVCLWADFKRLAAWLGSI